MKKLLYILIVLPIIAWAVDPKLTSGQYALAQAPTVQVLVEKKILNPQNNQFVDNLSVDQFLFLPNQEVVFKLEVRNNTQSEIKNVTVKDILPVQTFFVSGDGQYDKGTNTIIFNIETLAPNSSKPFQFKAQVKGADEITSNVMCVSNLAQMTVGGAGGMMGQDTANFCIQKQVLGAAQALPVTGPSYFNVIFPTSLALFVYGIYLKYEFRGGNS